MDRFNLHLEAINNFNRKAEELLLLLVPIKDIPRVDKFKPELFINVDLSDKEIISKRKHSLIDISGQEISKYFVYNDQKIGLEEDSYFSFYKLCESLHRIKQIREVVSLKNVLTETFDWMELRYKGETTSTYVEYISPRLDARIKDYEIWIPIFSLCIESSFKFGKVIFHPLTKAQLDDWGERAIHISTNEAHQKNYLSAIEAERRDVQGLCAATMQLHADSERATQIAFDEVERHLNILRFYDISNFHPNVVSHCTVLGKQNMQSTRHYFIKDGTISKVVEARVMDGYNLWKISNDELQLLFKDCLHILDNILGSEENSPFQKSLIDTLQIYSKSALFKSYPDRLLYLFVAVESILSKNTSEPIQQNIADRLAFAIGRRPEERKQIVANFKNVYGFRSAFVHHANDIEISDVEEIKKFMLYVWQFLRFMILNSNIFKTREEMIDGIENIKYA